jgi:hypothetical protein
MFPLAVPFLWVPSWDFDIIHPFAVLLDQPCSLTFTSTIVCDSANNTHVAPMSGSSHASARILDWNVQVVVGA